MYLFVLSIKLIRRFGGQPLFSLDFEPSKCRGQPIDIAAPALVVHALLDHVYGGEPVVNTSDSVDLLLLAGAYGLPKLAAAIESELCVSLDSAKSLRLLKKTQTLQLRDLKQACEESIASDFERCLSDKAFLELPAGQLARILRREDLNVTREEVVLSGLFRWMNSAADRQGILGLLIQHLDFSSMARSTLTRLGHVAQSLGPSGLDLLREVDDANELLRIRAGSSTDFRPKRRCLNWHSPHLGSSSYSLCALSPPEVHPESVAWYKGEFYLADCQRERILRWKPGSAAQVVAGTGARVMGFNELSRWFRLTISPRGELLVADCFHERLVSFQYGKGQVLFKVAGLVGLCCSPNGALYVLDGCDSEKVGHRVQRVQGTTLVPIVASCEVQTFGARHLHASKNEWVYISDLQNAQILCVYPDKAASVVGMLPRNEAPPSSLCVTEDQEIYVVSRDRVFAFNGCSTEALEAMPQ